MDKLLADTPSLDDYSAEEIGDLLDKDLERDDAGAAPDQQQKKGTAPGMKSVPSVAEVAPTELPFEYEEPPVSTPPEGGKAPSLAMTYDDLGPEPELEPFAPSGEMSQPPREDALDLDLGKPSGELELETPFFMEKPSPPPPASAAAPSWPVAKEAAKAPAIKPPAVEAAGELEPVKQSTQTTRAYELLPREARVKADSKSLQKYLGSETTSEIYIRADGTFEIDDGGGPVLAAARFKDSEAGVAAVLKAVRDCELGEISADQAVTTADLNNGWTLTVLRPPVVVSSTAHLIRSSVRGDLAGDLLKEVISPPVHQFIKSSLLGGYSTLMLCPPSSLRSGILSRFCTDIAYENRGLWISDGAPVMPPVTGWPSIDLSMLHRDQFYPLMRNVLLSKPRFIVVDGAQPEIWRQCMLCAQTGGSTLLLGIDVPGVIEASERLALALAGSSPVESLSYYRRWLPRIIRLVLKIAPAADGRLRGVGLYEFTCDASGLPGVKSCSGFKRRLPRKARWVGLGAPPARNLLISRS
jgi:hypothetical protein